MPRESPDLDLHHHVLGEFGSASHEGERSATIVGEAEHGPLSDDELDAARRRVSHAVGDSAGPRLP